jgi:hypothetical protein
MKRQLAQNQAEHMLSSAWQKEISSTQFPSDGKTIMPFHRRAEKRKARPKTRFLRGGVPALVERDGSRRLLVHQFLFAHMGRPETFTISRSFRAS